MLYMTASLKPGAPKQQHCHINILWCEAEFLWNVMGPVWPRIFILIGVEMKYLEHLNSNYIDKTISYHLYPFNVSKR